MLSLSLKSIASDAKSFDSNKNEKDHCGLMRRQSGAVEVEVFWERNSGSIQGRLHKGGKTESAVVCGLPKRGVEMDELSAVRRYLEGAAVHVQKKRIEIWPRLLGGVGSEDDRLSLRLKLKGKTLEYVLRGAVSSYDPIRKEACWMELDRRFEIYESWAKGGNVENLCKARENFFFIAEVSEGDENVFTRAMNGLIYALAEDPFDASASQNLKEIHDALRAKIEKFTERDIIGLVKLTRAFGLALYALDQYYRAGYLTKLLDKNDLIEICQRARALEHCIKKNQVNVNLEIKCNLTFIEESAKRIESRDVPSIIPIGLYKSVLKLTVDLAFLEQKKSIKITAGIYSDYVKTKNEREHMSTWQWHYFVIGYIKDVIKYSKNGGLKERAQEDLLSYIPKESAVWQKRCIELRIRLYQVIWELANSGEVIGEEKAGDFRTLLDRLVALDPELLQMAKHSVDLIKRETACARFWREISLERKKMDLKPPDICMFFQPISAFIGREIELARIEEKLPPATQDNEKTKIVVLTGLGGVGKTQVARKFVVENCAKYSMVYTFDGQSEETLYQGYKDLVFRLSGTDITEKSPADVRNRVNALLEKKDQKGWLLLFDNVDDPAFLRSLCTEQLPKQGGCVLITSRSRLDDANVNILICEFKRNKGEQCFESINLLKTIIPSDRQCSEEILDQLAKELGDLPLALVQAGAYIRNAKEEGYNSLVYLASFKRSCGDFIRKFRNETTAAYHNRLTVTTTWNTSRKRIEKECPLADEALCLLAYFNPDEIATDWIERWLEKRGINADDENDYDNVTNIIDVLRDDYSMIRYDEEKREISIHRLVQQVVRESLNEGKQRELIKKALNLVKERFDGYNYNDSKTWGIGRECLPHAISVANHVSKHYPDFNELEDSERKIPEQMGVLFSQMGAYTLRQGNPSRAKEWCEQALEMYKAFYGAHHPLVAGVLHNLGVAWNDLGEPKKAIEYYTQALEIYKAVLGDSHPDVAATLNNLGAAWSDLGETKKAIEYYTQVLEIYKAIFDESHPSVAETLNNLGTAWSALGQYKKAIEFYEKALEMDKAFYGERHPNIATVLDCLGQTWSALGQYKKAIEYYTQALEIYKAIFDDSHPDVAMTLNDLGTAWSDLGEPKKAIEYYTQALEMTKAIFGGSHPSVAEILHNLGMAWGDLGENKKATQYYEKALEMKQGFFGESHPSVAKTLNNLGLAWSELGEKEKAIEYYEKALRMTKAFYGESHPLVADILNNLGLVWSDLGEKKKAIEYYEKALKMKKAFLGESHPSVAETIHALGKAWSALGEKKKAIEYYEKALEIKKAFLGERHPSVAEALNNLGLAWNALGEKKKAIEYYEKALEMTKAVFGKSHPLVAKTLSNLGLVWSELGEKQKAVEYYEKALEMTKAFLGESHPSVAKILGNLGLVWSELGQKEKAIEYYEKVLEMTKAFFGESHPSVAKTLNNLGAAWSDLGERKKAIEYYEKALEMTIAFFGKSHPSIARILHNLGKAWSDLGEKKKAIEYYEKALEMKKAFLGDSHPSVADTLNNLGNAWSDLGEKKKAIQYYEQALEMTKAFFGEGHPSVASTLCNLGTAWSALGEKKKAIEYYEHSLCIFQCFYKEVRLEAAKTLTSLEGTCSDKNEVIESYEKAVRMYKTFYRVGHPETIMPLLKLANFYYHSGDSEKAKKYHQEIASAYGIFYGNGYSEIDVQSIDSRVAWHDLGNQKAIEYYEQLLPIRGERYGKESLELGVVLNVLGEAYLELNNNKEAMRYYERLLPIREIQYGKDHSEVVVILEALVKIYNELGNNEKLVQCYERLLPIRKIQYGEDSIEVGLVLQVLGEVYGKLGEDKKTIEYDEQLLSIREIQYGKESTEAGRILNRLGEAHRKLGNHEKVVEYYERLLLIEYRKDHPETEIILSTLGQAYRQLSNDEKTAEYYEQLLPIKEKRCGEESTEVEMMLSVLGEVYHKLRNNEKVIKYYERLLPIKEAKGGDHSEVSVLLKLGEAHRELGNHEKVIKYYERLLPINEKRYGKESLQVGIILNVLGEAYHELEDKQQTIKCYERAIIIYEKLEEKSNEEKHSIDKADIFFKLAEEQRASEEYEDAIKSYENARKVYREYNNVGEEHIRTLYHLGNFKYYSDSPQYEEAIEFYKEILAIYRKGKREEDVLWGDVFFQLGEAQNALERNEEAILAYQQALCVYKNAKQYVQIVRTMNNLGFVNDQLSNIVKAIEYFSEAYKVGKQWLPEGHEDTELAKENMEAITKN